MYFAVDRILTNLRMEGVVDLANGPGEFDQRLALRCASHLKAEPAQPFRHLLNIGVGRPESRSEPLGREPLMPDRRAWCVNVLHVFGEISFAVSWTIQQEQHSPGGH